MSWSPTKGSDAPSPSVVTVDAKKRVTPVCISVGWCQEGHPAHETLHQNPYFNQLTQIYLYKWPL